MPTLVIALKTLKTTVIHKGPFVTLSFKKPEDMLAASSQLAAFVLENGGTITQRTDKRQYMTIDADGATLDTLRQTPELMENIRHMEAVGGGPM